MSDEWYNITNEVAEETCCDQFHSNRKMLLCKRGNYEIFSWSYFRDIFYYAYFGSEFFYYMVFGLPTSAIFYHNHHFDFNYDNSTYTIKIRKIML